MQKISYWASAHITAARVLIAAIKILLAVLAYYTGILLYKTQVVLFFEVWCGIAVMLMLAAIVFYPGVKKGASKKLYYMRQKTCDFMLPLSMVLIVIASANTADIVTTNNSAYGSNIFKGTTAQEILNSGKSRASLTRKEKRILKREFFKQLKVYVVAKATGNDAQAGNAGLILLAIIAMVGLLYLLTALVCNLSCAGSDAAAVLVGILGLAGIIWGFIAVLKAIKRKSKTGNADKVE